VDRSGALLVRRITSFRLAGKWQRLAQVHRSFVRLNILRGQGRYDVTKTHDSVWESALGLGTLLQASETIAADSAWA